MLNELDEVLRAVVTPKEAFSVPRMKSIYNHHRGQTSKSLFLFIIAGISFTS